MISIILLIFKIIGILLLAILGLLLLIILTVLLVPIRYRIDAEHGNEVLKVEAKVNWLLYLIRARISHMDGVFHMRIKVLWFTLYDNLRPKKSKTEKQKTEKQKTEKQDEKNSKKREANKPDRSEKLNVFQSLPLQETMKTSEKDLEVDTTKIIAGEQSENKGKESKRQGKLPKRQGNISKIHGILNKIKSLFAKIENLKERIWSALGNLKSKILSWFDAVTNMKHKVRLILDFIKDEINREGFQITFASLKRLLKHILPTKLRSRIIFGTGDPCSTGQALGIMGILYGFYGDKVQIIPDFENTIFEGKLYARGRIRLITLLIIVIKLILDKRFKKLKNNFEILKEAL